MGTLSHLKRVVSPLSRSQPHFEARDLHPTQFGKICPNETPEGPNCGLVKNLAILSKISEGSDPEELEAVIKKMGTINPVKSL
jgi:DNA-directed RNA polymerase subunit B"